MARILFGGPEAGAGWSEVHDDLVTRLRHWHNVTYVVM